MQSSTENPNGIVTQFADHIPYLTRVAYRYTHNPAEAEDLVQDTLLLALRHSDQYSEVGNPRAWLSRVMRNRFISLTRRRTLERTTMQKESKHSMLEWSLSEASRRSRKVDGGTEGCLTLTGSMKREIERLKPEFREVVVLCDLGGLTYAEAADAISCPIGTVMSRLHRGRSALRNRLQSERAAAAA